jgi:uncharacterized protein
MVFSIFDSRSSILGYFSHGVSIPRMTYPLPTLGSFLHDQYDRAFGRPWPVIPSALVIAALNVFLFAFDRPWTASDGMRNWGDGLLQLLGVIHQPDLLPPLLYSGSVLNLGLLAGGMAAALLSREFDIRAAPINELIIGGLGGLLMGWGAMLSFGCNIGGFFSALSALSASGLSMMVGLLVGAFIATRYLVRKNIKLIHSGQMSLQTACEAAPKPPPTSATFHRQPTLGSLLALALVGAFTLYRQLGHGLLAAYLLFGVALGVVFQRSRFCLVNAFREPFMSGQSEHARAAALALVFSMIGFTVLKATDLKDAGEWVFPSFWLGALVGGILFGIGMVLAGGCGAGSIWRVGEGHVKLWVAVFFFAVGASAMRQILVRTDLIGQLGSASFLPNIVGWSSATWIVVILMVLWYLVTGWNEQRQQADVLKM